MRAFRLAKGVSQTALAAAAGVTFQQIQKYEKGKNRISASMMCRVAEALQINPGDLFPPELCGRATEGVVGALQNKTVVQALSLIAALPPGRQTQALKILQTLRDGD